MTIDQLRKKLQKVESRIQKHKAKLEQDTAEMAADIIRDRTGKGFGVDKNQGRKTKLAALSPDYVKQRKREGLTSKSRLTRTGQLLASIKAFRGKVILDGRRNKEVAQYVAAAGREFFHLSKAEYKRVAEDLIKRVKKLI